MESCRPGKWGISLAFCLMLLSGLLHGQKKHALVPDGVVLQHAGSIGYFSIGGSYEIFNNRRGNIDVLYGFVPKNKGGQLDILTAKFAYRPFEIKIKDAVTVYPLNPGAFFSYTLDKDLSFKFDTDQYGKSYYGWSEALRSHISFSQEVEINGRKLLGDRSVKGVVLYSEFNASDLYLVSWVLNTETLKISDIFQLGVGVKVKF